ncbi:hypothetical protein IW262DRAFT_1468186 [Armillaria fumosa]|nr:hypothetical protein IW262DRAFT_1468186 [Armillaria fumosa]
MRADECLDFLERFGFCFATSIGFRFGDITANATVGTPYTLTWYLDQGDDPDKLRLEQRLTAQNSGDGTPIPFSFPSNGTSSGTVLVTFETPGEHLVEALQSDTRFPISSSRSIGVSNLESEIKPISTQANKTSSTGTLVQFTSSRPSSSALISSTSPSYSNGDSSTMKSLEPTGSSATESIPSTTTTPNNPNSNKAKQVSTIIGAVFAVVMFFLFLALGVVRYCCLHRNRRHTPLPNPRAILQYLQIHPSSQHSTIHKQRGRGVSVPASMDVLRSTSVNSVIVDFDVEGVPGANLPRTPTELLTTRPLSWASDRNTFGSDPSRSEGLPGRKNIHILAEEPTPHASTSTLPPRARNDEMAEEIIRLRTQIQQLIVDRVSGWEEDRDMDPPPADWENSVILDSVPGTTFV